MNIRNVFIDLIFLKVKTAEESAEVIKSNMEEDWLNPKELENAAVTMITLHGFRNESSCWIIKLYLFLVITQLRKKKVVRGTSRRCLPMYILRRAESEYSRFGWLVRKTCKMVQNGFKETFRFFVFLEKLIVFEIFAKNSRLILNTFFPTFWTILVKLCNSESARYPDLTVAFFITTQRQLLCTLLWKILKNTWILLTKTWRKTKRRLEDEAVIPVLAQLDEVVQWYL